LRRQSPLISALLVRYGRAFFMQALQFIVAVIALGHGKHLGRMTIRVLTIARGGSRSQTGPMAAPPRWGVATTMSQQRALNLAEAATPPSLLAF
jgi:hypothetical protein